MELIRIRLSELRRLAQKHPGLMDAFLQAGEIQGDSVAVSRAVFDSLNEVFFGTGPKLGTLLHTILKPAVKAIDATFGTGLKSCGGCAERELKMNAI